MMKKTTLFLTAMLLSALAHGQDEGSGTITFNTSTNFPIEFTATDLFNGGNVYTISGNTNEAIPFGPWAIQGALGTEEVSFSDKVSVSKNPSSALNLFVKASDVKEVNVNVYDINGRWISSPSMIGSNNGRLQYYDAMTSASDGLYFVKVVSNELQDTFKFIKKGDSGTIDNIIQANLRASNQRTLATNNYIISWNNTGYGYYGGTKEVEVLQGSSNAFSIDPTPVTGTENGDVAIKPRLYGVQKANTTITLTNTIVTDSTYTVKPSSTTGIFADVFVSDANNPTSYQVDIVSNELDQDFLPTTVYIDIYQDTNGEINGVKNIEVTPIPNQQDITMVVRDFETLNLLEGVTIEIYQDDGDYDNTNDVLLDSQVSDANGEVFFDNVAGGTDLYFKNSKTGYYTKTNAVYSTPVVDRISEMDTLLNVLAVQKFNYWDATPVEASRLNLYRPLAWHTELALGHWRVYFPDSPNLQIWIDHFDEVATYLGFPNAVFDYDTAFPDPRYNGTIDTYQPYIENREVHDGLIGTNISNYNGTSTNIGEKVLSNGINITFYTLDWNLGGLSWNQTDHEIGNALGFPLITNTASYSSCRDLLNPIPIADSKSDSAIMPFWLRYAKLHFDMVDSEGRLIEFHTSIRLED